MEEVMNAVTHGIGTLLSVAGLVLLTVLAYLHGDIWHIVSFSIYGTTLVLLYLASTLYHSFTNERIKRIFKILDHSAIYLLIAGTYTPFTLVPLHGVLGWTVFGVVWGLAMIGIVLKIFFAGRFNIVSTLCYLGMGWFIVFAIKPLIATVPALGMTWLLVGGLFYTLGSIFYLWKKIPYNHAIWHLFVLAGSISHFIAVFFYILPVPLRS
ncbi:MULTISPECIES: PAQR family membrane homeostasis protein TrhA [Pelosinus]|jgi:hemolysin III|uniref:Channel protein, hemolysin III family n=1 Tax=Pelosinus fermentans B4 TaxID=1149862 RepID=I8RL07_9FIRM|nr:MULTISPECIES: hemolysin III family protein [Pelosinus]EIW19185.1 channel protein, hemolysin III family [Pelosinus fermentans B4]EIW25083.1 channel protein, hemolysin III family [Pelosinus fermentans A11]OAM96166.1 channel protein, hemolysin III family [Pelosinus fermentans DSM 17108]SDR37073.1 hemolysin III [Pelosinus fermentans]